MLVCFDLATTVGIAAGGVDKALPALLSWDLRVHGKTRAHKLLGFWNRLGMVFRHLDASSLVCYESPMRLAAMMHRGANEETIQLLRSLVALVELRCAQDGVPFDVWEVQAARKAVLGQRFFTKGGTKKAVIEGIRLLGLDPKDDNEADAALGWFYKQSMLNPRLAHLSTPLFGT